MKRIINLFTFCFLLSLVLIGCQDGSYVKKNKPLIVTTIYPYELIVKEMVDTLFTVETLLPPNASPHIWSPGPKDILKLGKADAVVSNGLGLEYNLNKTLTKISSKHIIASSFIDKKLLLSDDDHGSAAVNPHIWTSPVFLIEIVTGLSNELGKRFPENKPAIENNANRMVIEINQIANKIKLEKEQYPDAAIVTLHDAFAYYFNYFNIDFVGSVQPTAGKDPAPRQLQELADHIKTKKIKAIFIEPQMNPKPAEILAQELNLKVLQYDDLGTKLGAKTIADYLWLNWIKLKAGF